MLWVTQDRRPSLRGEEDVDIGYPNIFNTLRESEDGYFIPLRAYENNTVDQLPHFETPREREEEQFQPLRS